MNSAPPRRCKTRAAWRLAAVHSRNSPSARPCQRHIRDVPLGMGHLACGSADDGVLTRSRYLGKSAPIRPFLGPLRGRFWDVLLGLQALQKAALPSYYSSDSMQHLVSLAPQRAIRPSAHFDRAQGMNDSADLLSEPTDERELCVGRIPRNRAQPANHATFVEKIAVVLQTRLERCLPAVSFESFARSGPRAAVNQTRALSARAVRTRAAAAPRWSVTLLRTSTKGTPCL